jgi:ribose transport system ATP-binding protein
MRADVYPGAALACARVNKSYAGTRVLNDFSLEINQGEVHALIGENGSGKSTLIKVLAGVLVPDEGDAVVEIGGARLNFGSPESSRDIGCRVIHQDLGLINDLSVMDNVLLPAGYPKRAGAIRGRVALEQVRVDLERLGLDVDPREHVGNLSPTTQTGVAVVRALRLSAAPARLLILDEPTATLPEDETARLFEIIESARMSGLGILYVTHRLHEVFQICASVTVLRDGSPITTQPVAELDKRKLFSLMAGVELAAEMRADAKRTPQTSRERMVVHNVAGGSVRDASMTVHAGEIVGIAGITGSGRESILPLLFGAQRREAGEVWVDGQPLPSGRPDQVVQFGVGYLPPDRKTSAGFVGLSVRENLTIADLRPISSPWRVRRKAERNEVLDWTSRMQVRPENSGELLLASLSGGNQQKVLFGKWLRLGLSVFLLDEPTQGVDVNAKAALHRQLIEATNSGLAAVIASTDFEELATLCDRILIFRGGRIVEHLAKGNVTAAAVSHACMQSDPEMEMSE